VNEGKRWVLIGEDLSTVVILVHDVLFPQIFATLL